MKKLIIISAVLTTPLCFSQEEEPERRRCKPPQFIIDKFDADGDGKLNEEERKAAKAHHEERKAEMKEFRESFDFDGNGELDENEKAAFKEAMEQKIIEHFDEDGDGQLDAQEQANADEAKARREKFHKKHRDRKEGEKRPFGKKGGGF